MEETSDLLVLTFDGKGIPMRREDLRAATRKAAEATPRRLRTRLTKGEKGRARRRQSRSDSPREEGRSQARRRHHDHRRPGPRARIPLEGAYAFHPEGSRDAELWVQQRLMWLLRGEHAKVRANLRRNANARQLKGAVLKRVTSCLGYLKGVRHYLAYDDALAAGLPIAIEGACRYVVKERMEKTGARWSLTAAEAVLRLRALRASGDFNSYWALHIDREHARQHRARHADGVPPSPIPTLKPTLRRVK